MKTRDELIRAGIVKPGNDCREANASAAVDARRREMLGAKTKRALAILEAAGKRSLVGKERKAS